MGNKKLKTIKKLFIGLFILVIAIVLFVVAVKFLFIHNTHSGTTTL